MCGREGGGVSVCVCECECECVCGWEKRGEAGEGGRRERCSTKNKNPTRQCGEQNSSNDFIELGWCLWEFVLFIEDKIC